MTEIRRTTIAHGERALTGIDPHPWSETLQNLLGSQAKPCTLEEAAALLQERDPELFFTGLLGLAGREQKRGNFQSAAALYESLAAASQLVSNPAFQAPPALVASARRAFSALYGQGHFGSRAEFLLGQFAPQATDYRLIVPMLAASVAFNLSRASMLGRLAGGSSWYSRGFGARLTAALTGFAVEVPVFSFSSRGLRELGGESVPWDRQSLSKDMVGTALTLGALKTFSFLGSQVSRKAALTQASAFAGLLFAHAAEVRLGLRPPEAADAVFTNTLASLLSLNVGARLGRHLLGAKFASWESELGLRVQSSSQPNPWLNPALEFSPSFSKSKPQPAGAQAPGRLRPLAMSGPEDSIPMGRIRGHAGLSEPTKTSDMPFRQLVYLNNLFGGPVHALTFQKPGQQFTLGSKSLPARNYKNLHDSPSGKLDSTLVSQRDGSLHLRHRVENEAERLPNYVNLFRNETLPVQQAALEEHKDGLTLHNLTREPLVWTLEGSKWHAVEAQGKLALQDGSWIILGKDPNRLPENTLDPKRHTVLQVEYFRPRTGNQHRWNLIEFENREPAELAKIPTSEAYLATLLGQSTDFVQWRFHPLFQALEQGGWKIPEAKELLYRVFVDSPVLAELKLGMLAQVLDRAQSQGWTSTHLRDLLLNEALLGKNGMSFLSRLPTILEETSSLQISPSELSALLFRMAKYESQFPRALEALPAILKALDKSTGGKVPVQALSDFLERTQVSTETLRHLFSALPGGETLFMEMMTQLIPTLHREYGYSANTLVELSAELLLRIRAVVPARPAHEWLPETLLTLPIALKRLVAHRFGFIEQREILLGVAKEQGLNFAEWWRTSSPDRSVLEAYLKKESSSLLPGITTLGLGLLGLHSLDADLLRSLSPAFLLGATFFLPGPKPSGEMPLTFAWRQRFKIWLSQGKEKVRQLGDLAHLMENQGYLREARQRYEMAVETAEQAITTLELRNPDNRSEAGLAHRTLGKAHYNLAGFWRRRHDNREESRIHYEKALELLEPLAYQSYMETRVVNLIRIRLHDLYLADAEHWMGQRQYHRAGKNYEAAAEMALEEKSGLQLLKKAAHAFKQSDNPSLSDAIRILRKIREGMSRLKG